MKMILTEPNTMSKISLKMQQHLLVIRWERLNGLVMEWKIHTIRVEKRVGTGGNVSSLGVPCTEYPGQSVAIK